MLIYNIDAAQQPFRLMNADGTIRFAACTSDGLIHRVLMAIYNGELAVSEVDVDVRVDVALLLDQVPNLDPMKVEEMKQALWSSNPR